MAKPIKLAALIAAILATIFFFPRLVLGHLGPGDPWTSYLYQYGFGVITFLIGVFVVLRSGACRPGRGRDGFWLAVMFAGIVFFAGLHALWIVAARSFPFLGGN